MNQTWKELINNYNNTVKETLDKLIDIVAELNIEFKEDNEPSIDYYDFYDNRYITIKVMKIEDGVMYIYNETVDRDVEIYLPNIDDLGILSTEFITLADDILTKSQQL